MNVMSLNLVVDGTNGNDFLNGGAGNDSLNVVQEMTLMLLTTLVTRLLNLPAVAQIQFNLLSVIV